MAEFKLHCIAQSGNAYKVALMLALSGADWQPVFVDLFGGQTRDPKWRETVNEMGEAPVLEHANKKLTQSGAILTYLARQLAKFGPANDDEELEILRWILFDNHKFTSYFATYRFMRSLAPQAPDPAVLNFLKGRTEAAFAIVEKHLASQPFIACGRPTIADFSLAAYLFYPEEEHSFDFKATHPNIHAWTERIKAMPGWQAPYDLMPGTRFLAPR